MYYSKKLYNKKGILKMKSTPLEFMQKETAKVVKECDDMELLDLIYKLVQMSKEESLKEESQ